MANKKLGTAASELKLQAKKAKGDKKPKWQGKTGKGRGKAEEVAATEPLERPVEAPTTADEQPQDVTTAAETPTAYDALEPAPIGEPTETPPAEEPLPATDPEPTTKKPGKLKVKADLKPKKLSMIAAALQVLQDRKEPMTCPEMIDVMATESLWVSPGSKTPASTLYMVVT